MDFSKIMTDLENASLFDLYRLSAAINKELDNPARLEKIKRSIKPGDLISYFEDSSNRMIPAEVIEIKRTRALVRNKQDLKEWNIPFYMINIEGVSTDISYQTTKGMDRNEVKIGDLVGFRDNSNQNRRGKVFRVNPKTVTVFIEPNQKWRVPYSMLSPIIDSRKSQEKQLIEGVVIEKAENL